MQSQVLPLLLLATCILAQNPPPPSAPSAAVWFEDIFGEPWSIAGFVFLVVLVLIVVVRLAFFVIDCAIRRQPADPETASVQSAVEAELTRM